MNVTVDYKGMAIQELNKARSAWIDLPGYVYTEKYEIVLTEWIQKAVDHGRTDIKTLVLYALHHETGDKLSYFNHIFQKSKSNYECPRCNNEEHSVGALYCKICGLKIKGDN